MLKIKFTFKPHPNPLSILSHRERLGYRGKNQTFPHQMRGMVRNEQEKL
ncbi:MAG: hypothetical protein LBQ59_00560 [Candidatus Peribacteria bacterium]|jgi:hypothetical protein|nr:hypothetical protein [Candidatus Peribacteria bacterium]